MFQYLALADALDQIISYKKQLKNVIYQNKMRGMNKSASYSLLATITNNYEKVKEAANRIIELQKIQIKNINLMYILIGQMINMDRIKGGGRLKNIIIKNKHILPKLLKQSKINKKIVQIRIRKNPTSLQQDKKLIEMFSTYRLDSIVPNLWHLSYLEYSDLINKNPQLLNNSSLVIQGFSSALPAFLLLRGLEKSDLRPFNILDACAAPGNKTIQLCQIASKKGGTVHAFQKNQHRFKLLNNNMQKYAVDNVYTYCCDFLSVQSQQYKRVKFILLDPTCSGSGMLNNLSRDSKTNKNCNQSQQFEEYCHDKFNHLDSRQYERINKLHEFQLQLLCHAATFRANRISYSTCSIYQHENQDVIAKFLCKCPQYEIKPMNQIYKLNGNLRRGFGTVGFNCLRIDPRRKETDGFFICILKKVS